VSHKPAEPERAPLPLGVHAKAHALNDARDNHVRPFGHGTSYFPPTVTAGTRTRRPYLSNQATVARPSVCPIPAFARTASSFVSSHARLAAASTLRITAASVERRSGW